MTTTIYPVISGMTGNLNRTLNETLFDEDISGSLTLETENISGSVETSTEDNDDKLVGQISLNSSNMFGEIIHNNDDGILSGEISVIDN